MVQQNGQFNVKNGGMKVAENVEIQRQRAC